MIVPRRDECVEARDALRDVGVARGQGPHQRLREVRAPQKALGERIEDEAHALDRGVAGHRLLTDLCDELFAFLFESRDEDFFFAREAKGRNNDGDTAPLAFNSFMISLEFLVAHLASSSGLLPHLSLTETSAPSLTRSSTTSSHPSEQAKCKAVLLSLQMK